MNIDSGVWSVVRFALAIWNLISNSCSCEVIHHVEELLALGSGRQKLTDVATIAGDHSQHVSLVSELVRAQVQAVIEDVVGPEFKVVDLPRLFQSLIWVLHVKSEECELYIKLHLSFFQIFDELLWGLA